MAHSDPLETRHSLLRQLSDWRNEQAWLTFVQQYRPLICGICRKAGLSQDAVDEVAQRVLCRLAQRLRHFEYDPAGSFRAWLRRLVQHQVIDYGREQKRFTTQAGSGDSAVGRLLAQIPAGPDSSPDDTAGPDRVLQELGLEVQARVRARVKPDSWRAFWLTEIDGLSTKEAAALLGKTFAATFMARERVRRRLREEGERYLTKLRSSPLGSDDTAREVCR